MSNKIITLTLLFISTLLYASEDDQKIKSIINEIKSGWENGDGTPFRNNFLDVEGARYIESGGQNEGLSDLVEHHVEPEKDALKFLSLNLSDIEINYEGDFACAIANTRVKGEVSKSGRIINKKGFQTFLFRKVADDWKVVHTHSSSKDVKSESHDDHKH